MRPARLLVALLSLAAALGTIVRDARADSDEPIFGSLADIRAPIRIGWGYSSLYHARVTSFSFEDELSFWKLADGVRVQLLFGMDVVKAPNLDLPGHDPRPQGFMATAVGTGLSFRLGRPLAVVTTTIGPLFEDDPTNDLALHGIGVSARAELFPFYPPLKECALCEHGILGSYVLSGLHGWVLARDDWMGTRNGTTWAAGIGFEMGRNLLLPLLGTILGTGCSAPDR
jgi:hypothetical protein